jgi:hypothetical protein
MTPAMSQHHVAITVSEGVIPSRAIHISLPAPFLLAKPCLEPVRSQGSRYFIQNLGEGIAEYQSAPCGTTARVARIHESPPHSVLAPAKAHQVVSVQKKKEASLSGRPFDTWHPGQHERARPAHSMPYLAVMGPSRGLAGVVQSRVQHHLV